MPICLKILFYSQIIFSGNCEQILWRKNECGQGSLSLFCLFPPKAAEKKRCFPSWSWSWGCCRSPSRDWHFAALGKTVLVLCLWGSYEAAYNLADFVICRISEFVTLKSSPCLFLLFFPRLIHSSDTLIGKNFWHERWSPPLNLCWYVCMKSSKLGDLIHF